MLRRVTYGIGLLMLYSVIGFAETPLSQSNPRLVWDEAFDQSHPRNYRSEQISGGPWYSASGQFSEKTLKAVLPIIRGKLWIIDLRRESHGFLKGKPISWYAVQNQSNLTLSLATLLSQEQNQLKELSSQKKILIEEIIRKENGVIYETKPHWVIPQHIETEQQLVERLGAHYFRLPVSDHRRPSDEEVDRFVAFVQNLPSQSWLYFHCRGGKGRSTTFTALLEILFQAQTKSLEEILAHQHEIGGISLEKLSSNPLRAQWGKERLDFLKSFYVYVHSGAYPKTPWSHWIQQQN